MAKSNIEWTDNVWNPITGCTPISEGCVNCYAQRFAKRLAGRFGYPKVNSFKPSTVHPDKWDEPLHWKKPCRIFVCSMGDLFHEVVDFRKIFKLLDMMCNYANWHTYHLLTKRAEKMFHILTNWLGGGHSNIWVGITAETQERYDGRVYWLKKLKALGWNTYVSLEPLLGSIAIDPNAQDWVIVGGETGHGWRVGAFESIDHLLDGARAIRDQCKDASIPFFFKKMPGGGQPPEDLNIREFPTREPEPEQ